MALWCGSHGAYFQVSSAKSVVMVHSHRSACVCPTTKIVFPQPKAPGIALQFATTHRWLGIIWDVCLDFKALLESRYRLASKNFASVMGLVPQRAIPVNLAIHLFETKVDSVMAFGCWLYVCSKGAEQRLDEIYAYWAKTLLGAAPWRNDGVSQLEVGWSSTGFLRAVSAAALRRARLRVLPNEDLYASVFEAARTSSLSWHQQCGALLLRFGLPDLGRGEAAGWSYNGYKQHVKAKLSACGISILSEQAQNHRSLIPYLEFQQGINRLVSVPRSKYLS